MCCQKTQTHVRACFFRIQQGVCVTDHQVCEVAAGRTVCFHSTLRWLYSATAVAGVH
jgi:hypothetical protein